MTLKHLLIRPLNPPTKLVVAALVIALLGFADAVYLTVEHYMNAIPPCSIGSCETVLTSSYATVLGMPVALLGSIYYLVILVAIFAYLDIRHHHLLRIGLIVPTLGFLGTLWLIYLQLFVIHAICIYCMGSAITTTLLFIIAVIVFSKYPTADTLLE